MRFTRRYLAYLTTSLVLCLMVLPTNQVQTIETNIVRVYGRVMDSNGNPIPDAHITFWNVQEETMVKTNASGYYKTNVTGNRSHQVFAYGDNVSTPGLDYVPFSRQILVNETAVNVSFVLLPGASINAEGDIISFENLYPAITISFTVIDQTGLLSEVDAVTRYGTELLSNYILKHSYKTLVVPSNIPVQVQVSLYFRGWIQRNIVIDLSSEDLLQGDLLTIDLRRRTLHADVDTAYAYLALARALAGEAEGAGFYVTYERNELLRAEGLVDDAGSALALSALDEVFSNLREAYLIMKSVEAAIASLYVNASHSVLFITPFIGFTAVVVVGVLTDNRRRRLVIGLILYGILLALLYVLYPGYAISRESAFNLWPGISWEPVLLLLVATSFLVPFFTVQGLTYAFKEKTQIERLHPMSALASAFAMAARNLRRRRLRTLFTAFLILTSVFAFIALTNFALERGFFVEACSGQAPSEGFLLKKPVLSLSAIFEPITETVLQEIVEWLGKRPETALVAIKLENIPQGGPLGTLTSALGLDFDIWGILGIYPSQEVQVTNIDQIVEHGCFLSDEDMNGILISGQAADRLQVGVNGALTFRGRNFTVTGIFDTEKLKALRDLDGEPLLPYYIGAMGVESCHGPEVVIVHGETAQRLTGVVVSRVAVQTQSPGDIMTIARMMVLRWTGFEAYASMTGGIRHLQVGEYNVASGFVTAILPLVLVVLNVGIVMLEVVFERRGEVATMSSLGMNPFHISAVFVAEALVIGVVAGTLGYILGLTSYRFMAIFMPFGVKQKVEPIWGVLALSLSIAAAVLGSALPAAKASIIVTPSLVMRWKIMEKPKAPHEPWLLNLPLRIQKEESGAFLGFMERRLRQSTSLEFGGVDNLKVSGEGASTHILFTYIHVTRNTITDNELCLLKGRLPNRYTIRLATKTRLGRAMTMAETRVWETASFIRRLLLQYTTNKPS